MDILDVIRVAVRRWYVVLLVVLVGGGVSLWGAATVTPQYKVEATSILISGRTAPTATGAEGPINPYLSFSGSLFTTLSAVTRTVDGREYRERLEADGEERDYEFSTSQEAPVIITEAVATTPEGATELSAQVQEALAKALAELQSQENVPDEQQIVLRVLTTAAPVQEVGSRNRVLFGGFGLTFALAIGAAVLAESVAQARRGSQPRRDGSGGDPRDGRAGLAPEATPSPTPVGAAAAIAGDQLVPSTRRSGPDAEDGAGEGPSRSGGRPTLPPFPTEPVDA